MTDTLKITIDGKDFEYGVGVHDMPMRHYLALPAVSRSFLFTLDEDSPADAVHDSGDATPTMNLGTAVHIATLQPEEFYRHVVEMPLPVNRSVTLEATANEQGVFSKPMEEEFKRQHPDMVVLERGDVKRVMEKAALVRSRPVVASLLASGKAERTFLWRETVKIQVGGEPVDVIVWIKSRPDFYDEDRNSLAVDIKTCASTKRHDLDRSIVKYGYDLQAALFYRGCAALGLPEPIVGRGEFALSTWVWLWVRNGKNDRPDTLAERMSLEWLDRGLRTMDRALSVLAMCQHTSVWPGLPDTVQSPEAPGWIVAENTRADEEQQALENAAR